MVELSILGSPSLIDGEGRETHTLLRQPKRLAVLSYLALARQGAYLRRDEIVGVFWPESTEKRARSSLSEALSRLRTALGPDVIDTRGSDEVRVSPRVLACDAWRFESAVSSADWVTAAELYRGELLQGLVLGGTERFDDWLHMTRGRFRRSAQEALSELTASALAAADGTARRWAERALEVDPLDAGAVRRLMVVLAEGGQCDAAIAVAEVFERRLKNERGEELPAETHELADGLRKGGYAAIAPGVTLGASREGGDRRSADEERGGGADDVALLKQLVELLTDERTLKRKQLFIEHVEPMYHELTKIHSDYLEAMEDLGARTRDVDAEEILRLVRARRARLAPVREKVRALARATRNRRDGWPREVLTFARQCGIYFESGTDMRRSDGSRFTSLVGDLEAVVAQSVEPDREGRLLVRSWLATSRLALEEGWTRLSDAYATARLSLMR